MELPPNPFHNPLLARSRSAPVATDEGEHEVRANEATPTDWHTPSPRRPELNAPSVIKMWWTTRFRASTRVPTCNAAGSSLRSLL